MYLAIRLYPWLQKGGFPKFAWTKFRDPIPFTTELLLTPFLKSMMKTLFKIPAKFLFGLRAYSILKLLS